MGKESDLDVAERILPRLLSPRLFPSGTDIVASLLFAVLMYPVLWMILHVPILVFSWWQWPWNMLTAIASALGNDFIGRDSVLAALPIALYIFLRGPARRIRIHRLVGMDQKHPVLHERVVESCKRMGVSPLPTIVWPGDEETPMHTFGTFRHTYLVIPEGVVELAIECPDTFRAILAHELAHIRHGDTWKCSFIPVWALTVAANIVLVLVIGSFSFIAFQGWTASSIAQAVTSMINNAALFAVLYILLNALLRTRELYADLDAASDPTLRGCLNEVLACLAIGIPMESPVAMSFFTSNRQPAVRLGFVGRGWRMGYQSWPRQMWETLTSFHPHPLVRLRHVDSPALIYSSGLRLSFVVGVATVSLVILVFGQWSLGISDPIMHELSPLGMLMALGLGIVFLLQLMTPFAIEPAMGYGVMIKNSAKAGAYFGVGLATGYLLWVSPYLPQLEDSGHYLFDFAQAAGLMVIGPLTATVASLTYKWVLVGIVGASPPRFVVSHPKVSFTIVGLVVVVIFGSLSVLALSIFDTSWLPFLNAPIPLALPQSSGVAISVLSLTIAIACAVPRLAAWRCPKCAHRNRPRRLGQACSSCGFAFDAWWADKN